MRTRSVLATSATAAAVALAVAVPISADAARPTETINRSIFDATPERTDGVLHLDGATAGELGGALDLTVTAVDGTLPVVPGSAERVRVRAVLTVAPGKVVTIRTRGEASAHIVDGTLQVNAYFDDDDARFCGPGRKRAKVIGDGLIAAAHQAFGGQASVSGTFRW